ncbi:MAG: hypothetical protein Q4B32_09515 [Clostridia bacterium]|nr:hypothetical protein [Clostridia bacterium]
MTYDAGSGTTSLVTDEVSGDYADAHVVDRLCATNNGLYGIRYDDCTVWRILNGDTLDVSCEQLSEEIDDAFTLESVLTTDDACFLTKEGSSTYLQIIDRATKQRRTINLKNAFCMAAYGQNAIVYAAQSSSADGISYTIGVVDLVSGNVSVTAQLSGDVNITNLCCNADGTIFAIARGTVYQLDEARAALVEGTSIASGDVADSAMLGTDTIAVIVDNSLSIREIDGEATSHQLTIYQPTGRSDDYKAFLSEHPEINLKFVGNANISAEEQFVQDMATRSASTDVYVLSDLSVLSTIAGKGMAADLSASSGIAQLVNDMYPAFQDLFLANGRIIAIPTEIYLAVPAYNEEFFTRFGFTVPATAMELLDLTETWYTDYAAEYPEVSFDPFSNGFTLTAILKQYEIECMMTSDSLTFDDDELAQLVDKYWSVYTLYTTNHSSGSAELYAFNMLDLPHSARYAPLLLSVKAGFEPVISNAYLEMTYMVVNPYSEHIADALLLAESLCNAWEDTTRVLLLASSNQAIELEDYAEQKNKLLDEIAQLNESDGSADSKRDTLQAELDILEQNRWVVTEAEVQTYQSLTPRMQFLTDDSLDAVGEQYAQYYAQLSAGKLTAREFLRALNNRVQMVLMEQAED